MLLQLRGGTELDMSSGELPYNVAVPLTTPQPWTLRQAVVGVAGFLVALGATALYAARRPAPAARLFHAPSAFLVNGSDLLVRANLSFDHQQYAAAANLYRRALAVNPNDPNVHINLAAALRQQHDTDGALAELQTALILAPDNTLALDRLGTLQLLDHHDPQAAAITFQRLLDIAPNYPDRPRIQALLATIKNSH